MNYIERITSIRTNLENNGCSDAANAILEAQLEMGTEGEMLMNVCSKLLGMKNKSKELYKLISKDADWLLGYAKETGYHIIPT